MRARELHHYRARAALWLILGLTVSVGVGLLGGLAAGKVSADWAFNLSSIVVFLLSICAAVLTMRQVKPANLAADEAERQAKEAEAKPRSAERWDRALFYPTTLDVGFSPGPPRVMLPRRHSEQLLVDWISELENSADTVLPRLDGQPRRTIFDLRADLNAAGIWSDQDVRYFDQAVRVRNAIVHGDSHSISEADVLKALNLLQLLNERLGHAQGSAE